MVDDSVLKDMQEILALNKALSTELAERTTELEEANETLNQVLINLKELDRRIVRNRWITAITASLSTAAGMICYQTFFGGR